MRDLPCFLHVFTVVTINESVVGYIFIHLCHILLLSDRNLRIKTSPISPEFKSPTIWERIKNINRNSSNLHRNTDYKIWEDCYFIKHIVKGEQGLMRGGEWRKKKQDTSWTGTNFL